MGAQATAAGLAVIWIGMLAWAVHSRTILMRWGRWRWDDEPAQFAGAFFFHSTIAAIMTWKAVGLGWSEFSRFVGWVAG